MAWLGTAWPSLMLLPPSRPAASERLIQCRGHRGSGARRAWVLMGSTCGDGAGGFWFQGVKPLAPHTAPKAPKAIKQ